MIQMVEKSKTELDDEKVDSEFIEGIDEEYEEARRKKKRIRIILAVIMIIILAIYILRFY